MTPMGESNKPQELYSLPVFQEPTKQAVLAGYDAGRYTKDDLDTYKAGTLMRDKSLLDTPKENVLHLYKKGYLSRQQLDWYKEIHTAADEYNVETHPSGKFIMQALTQGMPIEKIEREIGGASTPLYDPIDLFVDLVTGGMYSGVRMGAEALTKAGAKKIAVGAAKDVALGGVAGATMAGIDKAGGGWLMQTLGGILTPIGAQTVLTMGRVSFIRFMHALRQGNPEAAAKLTRVIREDTTGATGNMKKYLDEVAKAEIGLTKPYEFDEISATRSMEEPEIVEPRGYQKVDSEVKSPKTPETPETPEITPLTRESVGNIIDLAASGKADSEIMKQIMDSDAHGADLFRAIDSVLKERVAKAKGYRSRTSTKIQGKKYTKEALTKFEAKTGKRAVDLEGSLLDVQEMAKSVEDLDIRLSGHGDVLVKLGAVADEMAAKALKSDNYTDMLKAQEMIQVLAEYDMAIHKVRSSVGRTLGSMNTKWMKTRFHIEGIPKADLQQTEEVFKRQLREHLERFKDAPDHAGKARIAGEPVKYRFLKAIHEWQVGGMLQHYRTWLVNVVGNTVSNMLYTTGRAGGALVAAAAGGGKAKLKSAAVAEGMAYRMALDQLFSTEMFKNANKVYKRAKKLGRPNARRMALARFIKGISEGEGGSFWKAIWTGEGEISKHMKFEGQEYGGMIEHAASHLFKYNGKWRGVPEWATAPVGNFMRHGLHVLMAGDEIFKTLAYYQKHNSMIVRELFSDNAAGSTKQWKQRLKDRAKQLDNSVQPDPIQLKARQEMDDVTFTSPLGTFAGGAAKLMNNNRTGLLIKITTLPFFRIAVNLNKFAAKNTPLGLLSKQVRNRMVKGTLEEKAEIFTRMAAGTMAFTAGVLMAEKKMLSGRMDRKDWSARENADVMEYSLITENADGTLHFTDTNKLDPLSTVIAVGAGMVELRDRLDDLVTDEKTEDEYDQAVLDLITATSLVFLEPTLNKSFMQSASDTVDLVTGTGRVSMQKYMTNQIRKFIPRTLDIFQEMVGNADVSREVRTPMDTLLKGINPKALLPKRHSVYGTVEERDETDAIILRGKDADPVMQELLRVGVQAPPMPRQISVGGETKKLDAKQYDKLTSYLEDMGTREMLQAVIEGYTEAGVADDRAKAQMLSQIVSESRKMAVAKFMSSEYGEPVQQALLSAMELRAKAISGDITKRHPRAKFYKFLDRNE